jgi:hypothetical protein
VSDPEVRYYAVEIRLRCGDETVFFDA